jgi:anhydro-N-acetylmuramic acid kinase
VDIRGRKVDTVAFRSTPYNNRVRQAILGISNTTTTTAAIARLHFELGEQYAEAVIETCRRTRVPLRSVGLIGCHGQTIYHESRVCTLQIGEASIIAERTGIPVVSDFRPADIAAGGEGAPLVPLVDKLLFGRGIAVNIGGIANITVMNGDRVTAFDTGPGNMVIDALVQEHTRGRQSYDRNGRLAAQGAVDRILLDSLLSAPYYKRKPPKTAGREQYGKEFVEQLRNSGVPILDLIATVTVFTAATISIGIRRFSALRGGDVIVSGGGAHNHEIMSHLTGFLPAFRIATAADYGIDVDGKEAIAFAILAHQTWHKRPGNLPSATGARHAAVLGKVNFSYTRTK